MKRFVRGGDNRIFKDIRSVYSNMLRASSKVNSLKGKKSIIIKEEFYDHFIHTVINDGQIDKETRLLVGLLTSSGLRISEVLMLKISQIDLENNRIRGVEIQKKRNKNTRLDKSIHPYFLEFLKKELAGREGDELIVKIENRFIALRRVKKYFAMDCHSFRHSFVNYWLSKNRINGSKNHHNGLERLTQIMGWGSFSSSFAYSQNCDVDKELDSLFDVAPIQEKMAA